MNQDYGEDFLVRIFEGGIATPFSFFIQAKSTDNISAYLSKDKNHISYPIKADHIEHWNRFWEPVVLTIWDSNSDITYWEIIQRFAEEDAKRNKARKRGKSLNVSIPIENRLDVEGVKRIMTRTKTRFERFEREQEGAQVLIDIIKEQWEIEIEYGPQEGVLILPKGRFVKDTEGGFTFISFGKYAARMEALRKKYGISPEDAFWGGLDLVKQVVEAFSSGNKIALLNKDGTTAESWNTPQEFFHYINRQNELDESDG